jgi:hypothetical protein
MKSYNKRVIVDGKSVLVCIRENVWGNWYGYVSGRKVMPFFSTPDTSQEEEAWDWFNAYTGGIE